MLATTGQLREDKVQIGDLLNKLDKVKRLKNGQYTALCPAHNDKNPSLAIKQEDTKILLNCLAGCQTEDIVKTLGLSMNDLFTDEKPTTPIKETIAATYDYTDEDGKLLFQVVRFDPKSFRQRHRNGNEEWQWDTKDIRKVIYHLPDILKAIETVYYCEGEKDVDNLWGWGQVATTSPGGANAWSPNYAQYLKGKKVTIIPDNDAAGYNYAKSVARSLIGKAREIKCILLPSPFKDISDWLDGGGDISELPSLEQDINVLLDTDRPKYDQEDDAIVWHKAIKLQTITFKAESVRQERTGIHARISILCDLNPLAWGLLNIERSADRVTLANSAYKQLKGDIKEAYSNEDMHRDLNAFCFGLWDFTVSSCLPELMIGDDSQEPLTFMLYPYILEGGGTILFAPPGRGKSNTALLWAVSIDAGINTYWKVKQTPVLFVNLERSAQSLRRRLARINRVLGLPATRPLRTFNARGKSLSDIMPACRKAIKQYDIEVVVLDSISRAGFGDLTENKPVNAIIDNLSSLSDTWLALGHTPRSTDEHVFGGIHFDAGADIVVQLASEISPDGTLGIGYKITKSNDLPSLPQAVWALEFDTLGLSSVRKAKPAEFLEVEGKNKRSMLITIMDWLQDKDTGEATGTEIADTLGFNRANVSDSLNKSGQFVKTRKEGKNQFYGVKA